MPIPTWGMTVGINIFLFRIFAVLAVVLLAGCANTATTNGDANATSSPLLFDDFSYNDLSGFYAHGWKVRNKTGHPGVEGATWSAEGVSFPANVRGARNGVVRISAATDGTSAKTRQTQICQARKFREGTYAARVFLTDSPATGPDGDEVIESFYAISPLTAPMDPDYSEADFEYLPNGGWGKGDNALWATSWETFQLKPWKAVNQEATHFGSLQGWNILVLQVADNKLRYYVNGQQFAEHGEKYYPEVPMSINFNVWFTKEGAIDSSKLRVYGESIDWVFFYPGKALSTAQVKQKVERLRDKGVSFRDDVPEKQPPLASPCGL